MAKATGASFYVRRVEWREKPNLVSRWRVMASEPVFRLLDSLIAPIDRMRPR